jgi:hypothetical protein
VAFTDSKERKRSQIQRFTLIAAILSIHSFSHNFQLLMNNKQSAKMHLEHFWNFSSSKTINPKTFHTPPSHQEFVELLSCHTSCVPINFPEATTLRSHDVHLQLAKNVHSILIQVLQ